VCRAEAAHPLARRKAIPLQKLAGEPRIGLPRKDHPEYYRNLDRIFAPTGLKPRVATERDSGSSLLIEVEAGRGMALCVPILKLLSSKRVVYRRVTGTTEWISTGIARSARGDLTPAAERFCEILRTILNGRRSNQSPLSRIGMDDLLKPHLFRTE